jgi:hypothetical protein
MSKLDRVIAAVTLPESAEAWVEDGDMANEAARPGDWLSQILDHHLDIEDAFDEVKSAADISARTLALHQLAIVLTGHAIAEECVIYPALGADGEKAHAAAGYDEQAMVKVQMALIEKLDPMSQNFLDKLEHIEGAVAHHVYAEEGNWFLDLKQRVSAQDDAVLTLRYAEKYDRYVGSDAPV